MAIALIATLCETLPAVQNEKDASDRSEMELKSERVFVFKDGYFLVVKSGTVTTNADGQAFTYEVPDSAVLGSFWTTSSDGTIHSMKAGWAEEKTEKFRTVPCKNTIQVIRANEGKECSFLTRDDTRLSGVIGQALLSELEVAEPVDHLATHRPSGLASPVPTKSSFVTSLVGDQFVLKTEDGDVLVKANEVRQLMIKDMVTTIDQNINENRRRKKLTIKFKEANRKVQVTMIYFRPGFRWIPSYRINLSQAVAEVDEESKKESGSSHVNQKKLANIIMQGELINEAEDLIDMPIDVVVGVPNFRFKNTPSPMVLESVMINALAGASPQLNNLQNGNIQFSNAVYSQASSDVQSGRAGGGAAGSSVVMPEGLTGEGGNDLFVYHLPKMTLKKGERAMVPIMEAEIPYRDVYTWEAQVKHNGSYTEPGGVAASPLRLSENKVWRQVDLINDTKIPWTTGAAMFVDGYQPVAQELLTYTSPGSICRVPVTVSVDMRGRIVDSETDRKPRHMNVNGHNYARINGEKELELANNKLEAVPVEITLTFGGRADSANNEGEIRVGSYSQTDWENHSGYNMINNSSTVSWTTSIEPGQCFNADVVYHDHTKGTATKQVVDHTKGTATKQVVVVARFGRIWVA